MQWCIAELHVNLSITTQFQTQWESLSTSCLLSLVQEVNRLPTHRHHGAEIKLPCAIPQTYVEHGSDTGAVYTRFCAWLQRAVYFSSSFLRYPGSLGMRLAYYCIAFSDQRWDVTATYVAYRELSRVSTLKWPGATIIAPETSWSLTSSHTHISRCSNDFSKAEILQGNFELCEITINSPYFAYQQTACESYFMHSYIQFSVLSNSYMPLNYRALPFYVHNSRQ